MSVARAFSPLSAASQVAALIVLAIACFAAGSAARAEPTFPQLTGRVVDEAGLLSPEDEAAITAELAALEAKSTDQVAVVTLNSLQGYEIEDFGYQLGRHWGIGQKGKDNGVLLIVAPKERKVRIEVGRRLEPILTDGLSHLIIQNAILPEFRHGDFPAGIRAGVRDIKDVLLGDAEAVKDRARKSQEATQLDAQAIFLIIFWTAIVIFVLIAITQSIRNSPQAVGGRRRRGGPIIIPGNYGGWGGGWSGGGGGGGWSGGGGDFGGGGSSGSW